ncbi:MAG: hypothetical protein D6820_14480, partial [Lentisphaerae bacterium]
STIVRSGTMTVTDPDPKNPGFLRVSSRNPRYFEFANGEFFYPVGHNLRSPSDRRPRALSRAAEDNADRADRLGVFVYREWFEKMHQCGANFTRVWMAPWWCGLEWNNRYPGYHGIAYYNQQNAARLDTIMQFAQQYRIYVNLETANHGMFSTLIDHDWEDNPYNKAWPGGFLEYATDFFRNLRAWNLHRQRLRYTVARWGYSPALAIWGLLTETEWTEAWTRSLSWVASKRLGKRKDLPQPYPSQRYTRYVEKWLTNMSQFIAKTDAHPHIITTHFSNPQNGTKVWKHKELQVVHNNAYTSFVHLWMQERFRNSSGVADIISTYADYYSSQYKKPVILGEWGGHPARNTAEHLCAEFHTGLWVCWMSKLSGATGYWWWNLLDSANLYPHYRAFSRYIQGEDRRNYQKLKTSQPRLNFPELLMLDNADRHARILYSRNTLWGYIFNTKINRERTSIFPRSFDDKRFEASGIGILELPADFENGKYSLEYWNTFTGQVIDKFNITIDATHKTIPIMSHRVDLAIKLKPLKP